MPRNPKNYGDKIKSHEKTTVQGVTCSAFAQWKTGQQIDREHQKAIQKEVTFWRQVLLRIVNIIMTLATMTLAFKGHHESVSDDSCYGGNFLAVVAMQARFDSVLQDLKMPARKTKYMIPMIQNEMIQLTSNRLRNQLISKIREFGFTLLLWILLVISRDRIKFP